MKKHDLEHIIKSKLKDKSVAPPPSSWEMIERSIPKNKSFFSRWYNLVSLGGLSIALIIGSIIFLKQPKEQIKSKTVSPVKTPSSTNNFEVDELDTKKETINHDTLENEVSPSKNIITPSISNEKEKEGLTERPIQSVDHKIKNKTLSLRSDQSTDEALGKQPHKDTNKIIRIVEYDTVVTQEHIYR